MNDILSTRRAAVVSLVAGGVARAIGHGEAAPRFTARSMAGERFTNESLKGKVVLLQFWATWCKYCRRDQEPVDTLTRELRGKGLVVLAVNMGEPRGKVAKYLQESPRQCPIVLAEDTNLAAVFAAKSYPLYFVIDREGKLAGTQNGAGGEHALRRLLAKAGLVTDR